MSLNFLYFIGIIIFREQGVEVIPNPDQDTTDLDKCLHHVLTILQEKVHSKVYGEVVYNFYFA